MQWNTSKVRQDGEGIFVMASITKNAENFS